VGGDGNPDQHDAQGHDQQEGVLTNGGEGGGAGGCLSGHSLVLMGGLCIIEAPYLASTCYCGNAIILERVCSLIETLDSV
jgi:hypothetical protein